MRELDDSMLTFTEKGRIGVTLTPCMTYTTNRRQQSDRRRVEHGPTTSVESHVQIVSPAEMGWHACCNAVARWVSHHAPRQYNAARRRHGNVPIRGICILPQSWKPQLPAPPRLSVSGLMIPCSSVVSFISCTKGQVPEDTVF
jgi:hypothetical protein